MCQRELYDHTIVADPLEGLGETLDKLRVEHADLVRRAVGAVDGGNVRILALALALLEKLCP
jgi:hypothetical protein